MKQSLSSQVIRRRDQKYGKILSVQIFPEENKKKMRLFPYKIDFTSGTVDELLKIVKDISSLSIDEINIIKQNLNIAAFLPIGISAIGAPRMWSQGITGKNIIVAVLDSGIIDHPDLAGKVVIRRNYTGEVGPPQEIHGTHVSGTIAANGLIRGVAFETLLGDYRVLNNQGSGSFDSIVAAIYDAVRDGAHIINMSLGGPVDYPPLRAAIQYAVNLNVPVIVAAGNEGDGNVNTNEFSFPAMYPTTRSIGAAQYNGSKTQPAFFTNTNIEVDCCAQGVGVISTINEGQYASLSGTSMSCPHIAGAMALLIHKHILQRHAYNVTELYNEVGALAKDIYILGRDNATGKGFITFNPTL